MDPAPKSRDNSSTKLTESPKVNSNQTSSKLTNVKPKPLFVNTLQRNTGNFVKPKIVEEEKERAVGFLVPDDESNTNEVTEELNDENPDSSYMVATPPIQDEFFIGSPTTSIDISVRDLNSDILVALVDRATEMKDLFNRNKEYFDLVQQSIFSPDENEWNQFLNILYSPRDERSDGEWMSAISEYMEPNPTLLVTFKEIVGYNEIENDDDDFSSIINDNNLDENDINEENDVDEGYNPFDYYSSTFEENDIGLLDICAIRDYPKILENLETSYPQFFINAKQELSQETKRRGSILGGNHLSQSRHSSCSSPACSLNGGFNFGGGKIITTDLTEEPATTLNDEFKSILVASREEISDEEWEIAIYECLDPWPQLVAQFEEIIKYEISND
ncbi:4877_t:CDS:1 [Diversispora eburnea]|uniref:4877_t:CDS:1 n=1 Tax=Diversispora eburnea TaxID=1213867 RepID=A0A9N9A1C4_9GLOM|nr:4877_t:CDS:1 [Diversispora eburnea]